MKYQAIIFDMDGTIIESEHIWDQASHQLLIKRGITITKDLEKDLKKNLHGKALHQSCAILKEVGNLSESLEELIKEKSAYACKLYEQEVRFIDGFLSFFKKIVKQHQLKVGIATNADDQTIEVTNKKLGLVNLFGPHVYGISRVNFTSKPNPAIYLHTAEKLEVDPQDCIAIEDSPTGIDSAQGAGMFCIGINSRKNRKHIEHAEFVIDHYDEINIEQLLGKKGTY